MKSGDGQAPVLIRVLALDAEPEGGAVHGVARIDIEVTEDGVSLVSPESWRAQTSAAVDLGSFADLGVLRGLVRERPVPDAVAAFDAHAWDVMTAQVIGGVPRIDVRKVVRAAWPDLPHRLETDPEALLAHAGGQVSTAATVPQPDPALARFVEAVAMLLGLALIGTAARQLHGPDRGLRDRVAALVRLSALPLTPPPWPPGPWEDAEAWRHVSGEELRRIAADSTQSDETVANAKAELARRAAA